MLIPQTRLARFDRRRHHRCRHHAASSLLLAISIFAFLGCQSENGNDANQADTGAPIANFSEYPPNGQPNLEVQFTDTSTGTVSSYAWDFGALGTSAEENPSIVYPDAGTYSVSLTVQGIRGTSQITKTDVIQVGTQPIAGFSCTPTEGFAPTTVNCIDESSNGTDTAWDFGDSTTASGPNASHEYTTPGNFVVTQTVSGPGGSDQTTGTVDVFSFGIIANPANGTSPAPADVTFTPDTTMDTTRGTWVWAIEGAPTVGSQAEHRFNQPGTYPVRLDFGDGDLVANTTIDYVVGYGPPTASFTPSVPVGIGPLIVTMIDDSTGEIDRWEWDFGENPGDSPEDKCIYPAQAEPSSIDDCDSSSPSHEYANVGIYNVSLVVSHPDADPTNPRIESAAATDEVRVYIVDPSFELQTPNDVIAGAWTSLRRFDETERAEHTALAQTDGWDAGMPSHGVLWASLDGLGTDGLTSVETIENGIQQSFYRPFDDAVLEFDYVLLYAEPPSSPVMDAVTATVSDGSQSVDIEILSARADVSSPYVGLSTRFPTRDGSDVRVTPLLTASINLADAFCSDPPCAPPSAPDTTLFTLTIRTTNAVNEFRSPRAYVDNIRFVAPADDLTAHFKLLIDGVAQPLDGPVFVFAGQEVVFVDTSCVDDPAATACDDPDEDPDPTSWRWDFDTQWLLPAPEASGSGDQNPVYTFPEAGVYDVTLRARLADLASEANRGVTVLTPADFGYTVDGPATRTFFDQSTSDPADPITAYSWDFGGWGTSNGQYPPEPVTVTFGQVGDWEVRLTITTASGNTDTAQATISVE